MNRLPLPRVRPREFLPSLLLALSASPALASSGDLYVTSDGFDIVRQYTGTSGAYQADLLNSVAATGQLGIHFGATNHRVLVGHFSGGVEEFDANTGAYLKTYNAGGGTQWAGLYGPNGNVLIGDMSANDVREYDSTTGALVRVLTPMASPADMLIGPNGNLYVCSFVGGFVSEVDPTSGVTVSTWAQPGPSQTNDIAFNPSNGEILVTVMSHVPGGNLVYRYDSSHNLLGSFAGAGWGRTHGITISPWTGNVLVADGVTSQVHEFDPASYVELNTAFLTPAPLGKIVDLDFLRAPTCRTAPGDCCSGRPQFDAPGYASFGPLVSVGTASPQAGGNAVVAVFDLGNPNHGPYDTSYPTSIYSDPSWSQTNLGSVFGVTLDPAGNIYVASTTCYLTDAIGALGNSGAVYKIDTHTSAASLFVTIPDSGPALGNLCYDCEHDQLFVSSMDDGRIYRVSAAGAILGSFDFGAPDNPSNVFAPLGDRVWAVQKHDGRLYFSVWWEDSGHPSLANANEIWSIALDAAGDFWGAPRLELSLPPNAGSAYSNPVSDMRFTPTGSLLVAERGMSNETSPVPHQSRLLEFECVGGVWTPSSSTFSLGISAGTNSAGGVDIDSRPCGRVYATGDALQLGPQTIYGTQGLPAGGGSVSNSILVDFNGDLSLQDKTYIGDVAVPCLPGTACLPLSTYCEPSVGGVLACPCANPAAGSDRGCDNSSATGGASLSATGVASLANDTLVFTTAGEKPTATTILLQGNAQIAAGVAFGMGVRCVGGSLKRLYVKSASGGSITAPAGTDPSVSARSAALGDVISSGGVRYYMAYYRDPVVLGGCGAFATFNSTAGGIVFWN